MNNAQMELGSPKAFHFDDTSNDYGLIKLQFHLISANVQWNEAYLVQQKKEICL